MNIHALFSSMFSRYEWLRITQSSHQRFLQRWKQPLKIWLFSGYFSRAKTVTRNQKNLSCSDKCGAFIPCSARYVLQVSAYVLLKIAPKAFLEAKKSLKTYHFWNDYSKTKTEKCNQKIVSYIFVTFIPFRPLYFLKVSASFSLKRNHNRLL